MPYPQFNCERLKFDSDASVSPALTVEKLIRHDCDVDSAIAETTQELGIELVRARNQGGATIFLCHADIIRSGVSLHLIDLMQKGLLTHLCIEPASVLCDWELASRGRVSPNFSAQLADGEIVDNLLATLAAGDAHQLGVGEALGGRLQTDAFPHNSASLLAQGYRWGVPVTIHAALGGALLHAVDNFDPGCVGRMLHRDFLILANSVENLDDGVVYQFGEVNASVEVYANALRIARNVAAQYGREINDFTSAVFSSEARASQPCASIAAVADPERCQSVSGSFAKVIPGLRKAALTFAGWE